MQTDGKIVVAGFSWNVYLGTEQNACVIQPFNAVGSIDSGFGSAGRVLQNFNPSTGRNDCFLTSAALQGDGKIVVAGNIADASHGERALIERLNANGSLDHSFASSGYYVVASHNTAFAAVSLDGLGGLFEQQREWATALALDNHARIVLVGGRSYLLNNVPRIYDWLVSRLNSSDVIFRDGLDGVVPD